MRQRGKLSFRSVMGVHSSDPAYAGPPPLTGEALGGEDCPAERRICHIAQNRCHSFYKIRSFVRKQRILVKNVTLPRYKRKGLFFVERKKGYYVNKNILALSKKKGVIVMFRKYLARFDTNPYAARAEPARADSFP